MAYADWKVQFTSASKGLLLSQGEKEAFDLIDKAKFIIANEPDFLIPPLKHPDSREIVDFKTHDSKLEALPSTEKSGRSTDASFVIRDELANHPYGLKNFSAVGPTVDAGGQLIDCSTFNKEDANNHFTERVLKSFRGATRKELPSGLVVYTGGESGATLVFGGWKLRPVRQEGMSLDEWFDLRVRPKYSPMIIEQEYPETIEDCFKQPQSTAFFDVQSTEDMLLGCVDPLKAGVTDSDLVRVYELPQTAEKYVIFTDPSDGSEDPFHIVVMKARTGVGVAEAYGKIPAEDCAKLHHDLVMAYGKAFNSYEINSFAGGKFQATIDMFKTPNQDHRRNNEGKPIPDKYGWWTSPTSKRSMMFGLEEAIRKHLITSFNRDTINQFKNCIWKDSKITMVSGLHDDAILAWAGVWAIRKFAPTGDMRVTSWSR